MQGHYLTHFAAMLQIKLNVFSCTFYRTFTMGAKGRKHADRAFIRGWAYNRMYFLFKGKFVYNGGPMGGGGNL